VFSAMQVGGEIDEFGNALPPNYFSYIIHFFSMPWKLLFSLTPPTHFCGGYPAFIISMLLLGCITAIIEQVSAYIFRAHHIMWFYFIDQV